MRLPHFEYLVPKSLAEATSLLSKHKGEARLLAGGTDLMVRMKHRVATPQYLIDLKDIPKMDYIRNRKGLKIGALTPLHMIETSPQVKEKFPALALAASKVASPQIRNRGTLGGNICLDTRCWYFNQSQFWRSSHAPCFKTGGKQCHVVKGGKRCYALFMADTAPVLIALGAEVTIADAKGEKVIPLEKLYTGVGDKSTVLKPGEMVTEVAVPPPASATGTFFRKLTLREAVDFAIVSVAASVTLRPRSKTCVDSKIVLGAISSGPIRAVKAEAELQGKELTRELMDKAGEIALKEAGPVVYIGYPVDYKRKMVKVLVRQALEGALSQAQGK